ncbi:MAG TPA: efflux RND transporter periplasmic adaptor subunit [Planctomycetaceae bacterium]|jgi:RND family efflux transporter MFP subunit|nr:efflux RND transporter periplasmic adaptor subunit [Planctomycetaceae bacterium]
MSHSPNNGHADSVTAELTSVAFAPPAAVPNRLKDIAPTESTEADELTNSRPWKTRSVAAIGFLFAIIMVVAFVAASSLRAQHERDLAAAADEQANAPPRRAVITVRRGAAGSDRELPGNAQADLTAAIYGRTNGYLKRWLVDIGDHVKEGQLLAEISTPEVDAQLEEAKATLLQSKANLLRLEADEAYARAEEGRYQPLLRRGAATREAYEQKLATWKVDMASVSAMEATIKVNEADIQRLTALKSYEKLTAPFDGIVTARNVDPGDLITADNPTTERQLFHVAKIDPLRVFVDVPQVFSTDVKPGQKAILYRREDPSRQYEGTVSRTANALDPNTRTLRTQVDVPNPKGALLPGMYLQVKFSFDRENVPVIIPTAAVIVRTGAPCVATLNDQQRVHYCEVKLGRDFGEEVEVLRGLQTGQKVIVYPGDDLPEGSIVQAEVAAGTK